MAFSCYSVRRLLTKSQMKKGAPSRAVMMPTGISARTLLAPAELPVGIITALLGAPFFIWLLVKSRQTL